MAGRPSRCVVPPPSAPRAARQLEEEWKAGHLQPRCGHIPGNTWGRAFNTGVFGVRNRPATLAALHAWLDFLTDPGRQEYKVGTAVVLIGDGGTAAVVLHAVVVILLGNGGAAWRGSAGGDCPSCGAGVVGAGGWRRRW